MFDGFLLPCAQLSAERVRDHVTFTMDGEESGALSHHAQNGHEPCLRQWEAVGRVRLEAWEARIDQSPEFVEDVHVHMLQHAVKAVVNRAILREIPIDVERLAERAAGWTECDVIDDGCRTAAGRRDAAREEGIACPVLGGLLEIHVGVRVNAARHDDHAAGVDEEIVSDI